MNKPEEHLEQMTRQDQMWMGSCKTPQDYDNVEKEREAKIGTPK